ncbi:MAG: EpsG family protein [Oscillospiraceae bacterium]|nr:EpsG family protein [Oscillospiraceae bacterium]
MTITKTSDYEKQKWVLLGILLFIIPFPVLAFGFAWYLMIKAPSKKEGYTFYIYSMFILAYCYEFSESSNVDLVRYFKQLEHIEGMTLSKASAYFNDGLVTEHVLFWIIAQLQMPHLLPAITTATVFGVGTYITYDSASIEQRKNCWKILLVQLVMIPFFTVVANVRNVFAFSIVILAVYRDLVKSKRNLPTLILYLLAIFMHKTGIILFVLRILVPVFKRAYLLTVLLIFSLPVIIKFAYSHIYLVTFGGNLGKTARRLISSSYNYLLGTEGSGNLAEYAQRLESSTGATVNRYIIMAFMLGLFALYLIKYIKTKDMSNFQIYGVLLCALTLACNVIDAPIYWRFAAAACLVLAPVFYDFFDYQLFNPKTTNNIWVLIIMFLILRFAVQSYRSREIFTSPIAVNILITNAYTIMYQFIYSVFVYL